MADAELVERIRGHVSRELELEADRKQEILGDCGIAEEDLSKVRAGLWRQLRHAV